MCLCERYNTSVFSVFLFSFPFFIALFQWGHHIRESANSMFVRGSIMKASLTVKPQMLIKVPCLLICHVTVVCTMPLNQPFFSSAKGGGWGWGVCVGWCYWLTPGSCLNVPQASGLPVVHAGIFLAFLGPAEAFAVQCSAEDAFRY